MNNIKKSLLILAVTLTSGVYTANAQVYVKIRPQRPHYERAVAPSPRHVWIDEDWTERGGRYEFNGGRWAEPPHAGMAWVPGHWKTKPRGDVWVAGHWR